MATLAWGLLRNIAGKGSALKLTLTTSGKDLGNLITDYVLDIIELIVITY